MSAYKVDLHYYRLEAIRFLQTLTIKFTPLAYMVNRSVGLNGYPVNVNDPETWKYYLNLTGQYHPSDTMMVINSLDTGEPINFTIQNLSLNPRTQEAYVPGTSYWDALCAQYPTQTDLIKGIVYPVSDIDTAIDAEDFTILSYGTGFLEDTEIDYIIAYLNKVLQVIKKKRYPSYLSPIDETTFTPLVNPYFYITFYGQLWHRLLEAIFTARFLAIRTVHVHSWHIWQYLESHGLQNYSDIMSREMQLFLYRNLNYLFWNRGKESTLQILNENILQPLSVNLYGRDVYQQTLTGASQFQLTPEFVAVPIYNVNEGVVEPVPSQNMADMNTQLVNVGDEVHTSQRWITQMQQKLSATTLNTYPTKVLELDPQARDRKYSLLFNNFVMDTLVTYIANGTYQPAVAIPNIDGTQNVYMTGKDILILLYYCLFREIGQTPTLPPKYYKSSCAYWTTPQTPPEQFVSYGGLLWMKNYLDVSSWMSDANYSSLITLPDVFSQEMSNHFLKALNRVVECRETANLIKLQAIYTLTPYIFNTVNNELNLTSVESYTQWFNINPEVYDSLITPCEKSPNVSKAYGSLIQNIYSTIVPCTEIMLNYGDFSLTENKYQRLKELFISLCSYNVTFVGNARETIRWFPISNDAAAMYQSDVSYEISIPLFIPQVIETNTEINCGLPDTHFTTTIDTSSTLDIEEKINLESDLTSQSTINLSNKLGIKTKISNTSIVNNVYMEDPITFSVRS